MQSLLLIVTGFSSFFCLHFITRKLLVLLWGPSLTEASVYVIACRCVSAIQGLLSFIVGAVVAVACRKDIMRDVHWLTNAYVYFGMPYFLYDMWAMYAYNVRLHEKAYSSLPTLRKIQRFVSTNALMVAHHLLLPAILSPILLILREDRGDYFFGVFYMFEIVIPFISAREILIQLNQRNTWLYIFTSLSMIIVFFFARLAIFPFLYHSYGRYADLPFTSVPFHIPLKCNMSCVLILAPQLYWFYLMVRGLFKALHKRSSLSANEKQS